MPASTMATTAASAITDSPPTVEYRTRSDMVALGCCHLTRGTRKKVLTKMDQCPSSWDNKANISPTRFPMGDPGRELLPGDLGHSLKHHRRDDRGNERPTSVHPGGGPKV